jgi:GNAT superfamily N-acetyltransferase
MTNAPEPSRRSDDITIRMGQRSDVPGLVRLINAAFVVEQIAFDGDRINTEETHAFLDTGQFLVAEDSSGFAGCVYVEVREDRGYLGLLAVDPPRQGTGLGRKLVAAAEDYFRAAGCRVVDLRIISPRTLLPAFYRRLGYVESGTAPFTSAVLTKVPVHYIIMSKYLG